MNEIYSHFISRDKKDDSRRIGYILWFADCFPESEFTGEDLIMFHYIRYCSRLTVPMKYEYFNVFMGTELRRILIDTGARVAGTDSLNYAEPTGLETAYQVAKEYLQNEFRILESYDSDIDDFKVAADAYINEKLNARVVEELAKTFDMLSATDNSQTTVNYALDNLMLLRDIYDESKVEDLDDDIEASDDGFKPIFDTSIPAINADIKSIKECQLLGIEAQPGVGKTRYTLDLIYRAAVIYKQPAVYYQLEQSKAEAVAMLTARHMFTLYNIQVSDGDILSKELPPELISKVEAAKIDLFESGKYGKIYINSGDLYVNTLAETLRKDDKLHGPFKVVAIDYIGLIMQESESKYHKEMLEFEIINKSLRKFKHYVRKTHKVGIAVSQFNQKGIEAGKADKEITTDMAQGGIAVYRHTDQNFALSRTTTMEAQQKMRISQPKKRGSKGFGSVVIDTRLGFLWFYVMAQQSI